MTATDADRTPLRHLAFARCVVISLLALMAAPGSSVAQIGGQTGYQEWVPPGAGTGATDRGGGAAGGSRGGTGGVGGGGGGAGAAGGGAWSGGTGGGLIGPAGDGTAGGTGGVATGRRHAGTPNAAGGVKPRGGRGVAGANQGSESPRRLDAGQSETATGTIPLTRDNILLALAVAAGAIGAGFGVNRLARRSAGV